MKQIVIFASGSGSNTQQITEFFLSSNVARVMMIYSNREDAFVLQRAGRMNIPTMVFNRSVFYETDIVLNQLNLLQPDLLVLAGFLWKIPEKIIRAFPERILNIHPALLPKYGGKGMYGERVHRAVIENRDQQSGITIHYVNENYDEGKIIFQANYAIEDDDTPETLAVKIHELEHKFYPKIIEQVLMNI